MARAKPRPTGREPAEGSRFPAVVLAENIRAFRVLRGITQDQLGELMAALGHPWTGSVVGFTERQERTVSVEELLGLAIVFGATIGELLDPAAWRRAPEESGLDVGGGSEGQEVVISAEWAPLWVRSEVAYSFPRFAHPKPGEAGRPETRPGPVYMQAHSDRARELIRRQQKEAAQEQGGEADR